jgi:hypothetical protein
MKKWARFQSSQLTRASIVFTPKVFKFLIKSWLRPLLPLFLIGWINIDPIDGFRYPKFSGAYITENEPHNVPLHLGNR